MDVLEELARVTDRDREVAPHAGGEVFRRGRARVRRRRALGGGTALAVVAAVVALVPGMGPDGLRIDDTPPVGSEPTGTPEPTTAPPIPDGWQLVEVADASFAVPEGFGVDDIPHDGSGPCWNEGPIVFIAAGDIGPQGGCRAFANYSTIVVGARVSTSDQRQRARDSGSWEQTEVNGFAAVVDPGSWSVSSHDPRRTVTYLVDDLDLYLRLLVAPAQLHLVDEIVATIAPRGADRTSAEAPDQTASAEAAGTTPIPDDWQVVEVGNASFAVPGDLERVDVPATDDRPCPNTGPRIYVAIEGFNREPRPGSEGSLATRCEQEPNAAPVVEASPHSEDDLFTAAFLVFEQEVHGYRAARIGPLEDDALWPEPQRVVTWVIPDLDLVLVITTELTDAHLEDEILATITPRGDHSASAEAPGETASAEAPGETASDDADHHDIRQRLTSTTWELIGIAGPAAIGSGDGRVLHVSDDGTFTASGCNQLNGTWELTADGTLWFPEVGTTDVGGCTGHTEQHVASIIATGAERSFAITDEPEPLLQISTDDGRTISFAPRDRVDSEW